MSLSICFRLPPSYPLCPEATERLSIQRKNQFCRRAYIGPLSHAAGSCRTVYRLHTLRIMEGKPAQLICVRGTLTQQHRDRLLEMAQGTREKEHSGKEQRDHVCALISHSSDRRLQSGHSVHSRAHWEDFKKWG